MKYFSQSGQDRWITHRFKRQNPKDLFFLDIGAHDGVSISNTFSLESVGWKGLCVEASPLNFTKLQQNRKCTCANVAITNLNGHVHIDEWEDSTNSRIANKGVKVKAVTFEVLLEFLPKTIDYLSLDIEGHEYLALTRFPFNTHIIKYMTIEHNVYVHGPKMKNQIFDLLTKNGYVRAREDVCVEGDLYPFEDWYAHESVVFKT